MKRRICLISAALLAGIYAGYCADCATLLLLCFCLIVSVGCKWLISRRAAETVYFVAALVFLLGAGLITVRGDITLKKLYPYMDEYVEITAEVTERPEVSDTATAFMAKITELSFLEERISPMETVWLKCREQGKDLEYGDIFTARVRLNPAMEAQNEGGFDYRLYMKTKHAFFTGYVDGNSLEKVGRKEFGLWEQIKMLNYRCGDVIDRTLTVETAPILKGILLGDKSGMSDELRLAFSRSGLAHIVAVSGLHVSTLLVLIFALFDLLHIKKRRAGLIAALLVVFFVCLTGTPPSAVRAGVMAIAAIGAEFIYRKADSFTSLAVASSVILLIWPFAAFDVGFLLSLGAAFGILLFSKRIEHALRRGWSILRKKKEGAGDGGVSGKVISIFSTTLSAQLITLPVILYFFQEFTFWGFITNLIVLPLLPILMVSGLLLCAAGLICEPLALVFGGLAYLCLLCVRAVAVAFGGLRFGYITFGAVTPFFVFFYGLCLCLVYSLAGKKSRSYALIPAGTIVMLLAVLAVRGYFTADVARVMFINVGQGDSACISLPHGVDVLIDAGGTPSYQTYYDVGGNTVRPYLLKQGVTDIEYMVASHGHDDHVMGLTSIIREMQVNNLIVPKGFGGTEAAAALLEAAREKNVPVYEFTAGDQIKFAPGSLLTARMPTAKWSAGLTEDEENNRSLVLHFSYGENSFLFTGDLEAEGEEELIAVSGDELHADVLKVGHHGSATSTAQEFLERVRPAYAFIPVGKNTYGHPDGEVVKRLESAGTQVFRADIHKDVVFTMNREEIIDISR